MLKKDHLTTWKTYQAAWSPMEAAEREQMLRSSVSADCIYTDPTDQCSGIEELVAKIERSQKQFPGVSFQNTKFLDHHDQGLFSWTMVNEQGEALHTGASFARFGPDGLLTQMTGFPEPTKQKD